MTLIQTHGLGRLPSDDERDRSFPMAALLAPTPIERTIRYWHTRTTLDQGQTSSCVGHAWAHYLADGPVTRRRELLPDPFEIYRRAQFVDEWPGESYDGTSVRAGAKVLQGLGAISSYWWASGSREVEHALLEMGPVVVGTEWFYSMFEPDPRTSVLSVDPASGSAGGHAWVLNGINTKRGVARMHNSWGKGWGRNGQAFVRLDDLDVLLSRAGEACVAVEVPGADLATA